MLYNFKEFKHENLCQIITEANIDESSFYIVQAQKKKTKDKAKERIISMLYEY